MVLGWSLTWLVCGLTLFRCAEGLTSFQHTFTPLSLSEFPPQQPNLLTQDGIFVPKQTKVVILWDLDNKPPRGPPYNAATYLKKLGSYFGDVIDVSAYANRHAFTHLPTWVRESRRERRILDVMERKGVVTPSTLYVCKVCGRKCKTNLDLKKHFMQLHERERQKKLTRMRQLKGKKRERFKERFLENDAKFEEGARGLFVPKVGYGLDKELRRAGVFVKTVEDKPQAADWALKRQMVHSMNRGIDWVVLVSDDKDFGETVRRAREGGLGTVVVGDRNGVLGRNADLWVSWEGVESGEVREEDLVVRRNVGGGEEGVVREDGLFSISEFDEMVRVSWSWIGLWMRLLWVIVVAMGGSWLFRRAKKMVNGLMMMMIMMSLILKMNWREETHDD